MRFTAASTDSTHMLTVAMMAGSILISNTHAFTSSPHFQVRRQYSSSPARVIMAPLSSSAADDEVQRLQAMAAKLRREAESLEEQQQRERSEAAERAFTKFDTNGDGTVSLDELRAALEKTFKMNVPDNRLQRLMRDFDSNGDGVLQLSEFLGMDQFRNRLEQITAEERKQELDGKRAAQKEAQFTEMIQSQLAMINDRPPTTADKIGSVLPYLFPLMDGLTYGRFVLGGMEDNPIVTGLAVLYTLYRSIPFSGFVAFFALSALGNNLSINRLTRFNIQQAIYLDIALILPGFFGAILALTGLNLPLEVTALSSDAIFVAMLAVIGYSTISSLLGVTPDKVPFISDTVNSRLPPPTDSLEFDFTTGQLKKKDEEKKDE